MNSRIINIVLIFGLVVGVFISFWIFSRFTVDDAFISWRYGKNLIDFGIWNYSPSSLDMTQAYTNPIFAFLSIIPNYFNIDVVLFFKIFSLLNVIIFIGYIISKTNKPKTIILFFILPATIIHLFSGLETFLFISLLVALFINLYENNFKSSIFITIMLFITRPETWLFSIFIPFYFLIKNIEIDFSNKKIFFEKLFVRKNIFYRKFFISLFFFVASLIAYFTYHKLHFGYALPNTFYIKSGATFNPKIFIWLTIVALPSIAIFMSKKYQLAVVFLLFFLALILSYSTSNLQMNYAERFAFHIFAPLYFILVFLSSKINEPIYYISLKFKDGQTFFIFKPEYLNIIAMGFLALFFLKSTIGTIQLADYYPRAIDSHAQLGKKLNEIKTRYDINSFSFGDAGMAAYHSKLLALDNVGLGSSMIAQTKGVNNEILNSYNPDVLIFYATPESIRINDYNQKEIFDWGKERGYKYVCDVYWRKDYLLKIYSKNLYDELNEVCTSSKKNNNISSKDYILSTIKNSPFHYWHE